VITADEGDHFVGGPPSPANCNGVQILCTYKTVGEVDGNLTGMLAAKGVAAPFDVQADSAPIVYVHGQPGRTSASVRTLERTAATLTASDLATGKTLTRLGNARDAVVAQLKAVLYGAEFGGAQSPAAAGAGTSDRLVSAASGLLGQASALAG
jgi:hypothetical protein